MRSSETDGKRALRIVHIEDDVQDAELIAFALQAHGVCHIKRVATRLAFEAALQEETPDLILSDSSVPGLDSMSALAIAAERCPQVPFIICSGYAAAFKRQEVMEQGATDFVSKDDLARLISLVKSLYQDGD